MQMCVCVSVCLSVCVKHFYGNPNIGDAGRLRRWDVIVWGIPAPYLDISEHDSQCPCSIYQVLELLDMLTSSSHPPFKKTFRGEWWGFFGKRKLKKRYLSQKSWSMAWKGTKRPRTFSFNFKPFFNEFILCENLGDCLWYLLICLTVFLISSFDPTSTGFDARRYVRPSTRKTGINEDSRQGSPIDAAEWLRAGNHAEIRPRIKDPFGILWKLQLQKGES